MSGEGPAVLWFRRDLRLADHPALHAAMRDGRAVVPLFVFDPAILNGRWASPNRAWFLAESLRELREALQAAGADLVVRTGDPCSIVPAVAREAGASDVYVSRDYSPHARKRDGEVARALARDGIDFHAVRGTLAVEPEQIERDGHAPRSYTQFKKRWDDVAIAPPIPAPVRIPGPPVSPLSDGIPSWRPEAAIRPAPGERAALARLATWLDSDVPGYAARRDHPADSDGTSRLSVALRFGSLSPNQVIAAARAKGGPGVEKFVAEVAWREFFTHLLWREPRVLREPLEPRFASFPWRVDGPAFEAWKAGRTGYPLVDAGMRELLATGYMHNRVRMVAASFLVKDLLLDWRLGEAFFMRHLFDGDPANNNGGWQWVAGCGADAAPFFRVFNPVLQSGKFDAGGEYIRRWLPELGSVPDRYMHEPWTMPPLVQIESRCRIGKDYAAPILDHGAARTRALAAFEAIKRKDG